MVVMDIYSIPQLDEIKEEIMVELRLSHYWQEFGLSWFKNCHRLKTHCSITICHNNVEPEGNSLLQVRHEAE